MITGFTIGSQVAVWDFAVNIAQLSGNHKCSRTHTRFPDATIEAVSNTCQISSACASVVKAICDSGQSGSGISGLGGWFVW
ncbi:MAG: hypothetical protein JRH15_00285 [Deltaproteobacteria bacterium]|nr:hypothetical protein [Deltaproteobacteria bacterium]